MSTSQAITIRAAREEDIAACLQLDLSYETEYVWQMDIRDDAGAIAVSLRTVRLPRPMRVIYPRDINVLTIALQKQDCFLVAETVGVVRGYLTMRIDPGSGSAWINDIAIGRSWRRQGFGSGLFAEAYNRAREQHTRRLTVETQTKNYPGIGFCQKHGLAFCGFNDRYYPNHDIALFFGQTVR
jgi:ribosomal protein S18 acetylase RimI-like enzyme